MPINTVKVTINGTTYTATKGSGDTYTVNVTAPVTTSYNVNSGHYFPVTVVATNTAGTSTTVNDTDSRLGSSLRLFVKETTAPTITVSAPTTGQYLGTATPTIVFTCTDEMNGSGVAIATLKMTLDGKQYTNTSSGVAVAGITNGYSVSFIPPALTDGAHTLSVTVADNDGNTATSSIVNFTTDTVAPTLAVTNPATNGNYVANSTLNVTGTASDSTSGTPTVKIMLNGTDQGTVNLNNGAFSMAVNLINGNNTIIVTATDKAGKITTITRTVILDTSSPVIASVNISPNPVNVGGNYTVTISVTG